MGKFGLFMSSVEEESKSPGIMGRGNCLVGRCCRRRDEEYHTGSLKRKENKGRWKWGLEENALENIWRRM